MARQTGVCGMIVYRTLQTLYNYSTRHQYPLTVNKANTYFSQSKWHQQHHSTRPRPTSQANPPCQNGTHPQSPSKQKASQRSSPSTSLCLTPTTPPSWTISSSKSKSPSATTASSSSRTTASRWSSCTVSSPWRSTCTTTSARRTRSVSSSTRIPAGGQGTNIPTASRCPSLSIYTLNP